MTRLQLAVLVSLVGACATPTAPVGDGDVPPDAATAPDLTTPPAPDLTALADASTPDASTPDASTPGDLLKPPDLAVDAAAPPDLLMPDLVVPMFPQSFSSPGVPPAGALSLGYLNASYPRAFRLQLDTDAPTATVFYTLDGTQPTTGSPSGAVPLTVNITQSTTVKYFARSASGTEPTIHTETFGVDAANQGYAGYVVEDLSIGGMGGVAVVAAGQMVTATANVQIWVQSSKPGNSEQLVYGVDDVDQGCVYSGTPNVYPGVMLANRQFTLTAPTTAGVHTVRVAYIQDISCSSAMASNPAIIKTRPNATRIGTIIVP